MSAREQELLQKRHGIVQQQEDILVAAMKESRNPTADEFERIEAMNADIAEIERTVELTRTVQDKLGSMGDDYRPADFRANLDLQEDPEGGFGSFGEFLAAVGKAGASHGRFPGAGIVDARLQDIRNAATGAGTAVPADGGFLVSPTRSNDIMTKTYDGGEIISRCATFDIGANSDSLEVPMLAESSRANGSRWGGIRAYRAGEGDSVTATKTQYGLWECRVQDIKALCYVTERGLQDAPQLESVIMDVLPQEFTFVLQDEVLNGDGVAKCKGIIGDPATVSVAKETGQVAGTIVYENIIKMWARAWGRSRGKANWYTSQSAETQLMQMFMAVGTGGVPVYMPANGLSGSPYGTLLGRPVVPVEQAAAVGTVGDIILGDFSEYALVRKGGLKSASSVHVRFINDEMTFKFNMRVSGKPKWDAPLTPFKGSSTLSPFVTLDTRA